jgi:hypothetical protein
VREDAIPKGLVGGGLRSRSPTLLQMWLIQWAPGACLAGLSSGAFAIPADELESTQAGAILIIGMMLGATLWALIALSSWPLFFAIRPWIDRLARTATRWRGAALAAAGVTPLVLIAIALRLAFMRDDETSVRSTSTAAWVVPPVLVFLGFGTVAAAEMWRVVLQPHRDTRCSQFTESLDITPAVRVKEDLEVLRILLANSAMGLLSVVVLLILPLLVLFILLVIFRYTELPQLPQPVRWVQFVPFAIGVSAILPLIVLTSYQIGLWHFVSVRTSGVLLFAGALVSLVLYSIEPLEELYVGSQFGYSGTAWVYAGLLCVLTVPVLVVIGSVFRMSRRLTRLGVEFDPVVRGWRAWPTNLWAHALRALCLPSFLVALPQGRTQPILLFALAAIISAAQTLSLFALVVQPPAYLGRLVRRTLPDQFDVVTGGAFPTVGAALTAVSSTQAGVAPQNILVVIPFFLVVILLVVAVWLSRKPVAWLLRRAQRRAALAYQTVLRQDTRNPVLFLRSFREDQRLLKPPAKSLIARMLRLENRRRTLDEIVLDAASPVGPVIALGAPDEKITPLGAARLYADDTAWQNVVRSLADRSRAIIICIEEGGGILWELEHLLACGHSTKTLCILNPRTSLAAIQRAIEESRRSGNTAVCGMLERIRNDISSVPTGKVLVGVRFADGVVVPIIAEDASDYTHWCMVNLMLVAVT